MDFYLTPVSDSNISQASGGREECIDTPFGRLCRPLPEKTGGYGLAAGAQVDYFKRFSQDWGLKASLGFSLLEYERDVYDDHSLFAALGPRRLWESGEASLQTTFHKRWLGGREYSRGTGLRLDARQIFGKLILDGGAAYTRLRYGEPWLDELLRGPVWSLNLRPRYILNDRTFIQARFGFLREEAREKMYASDNWRYALGVYRAFPYGFSLFLEGSLTRTGYQAEQWYVTRDHRIDETKRRDAAWGLNIAVSTNLLEKYRLTPTLYYAYTDRRSNIWSREYQRHSVNLVFDFKY